MRAQAGFAVLLIACLGLAACGEDEPKSLQEITTDIKLAEQRGTVMLVQMNTRAYDGGAADMYVISNNILKAAHFQATKGTGDVLTMEFHISVPTVDKLDNRSNSLALILNYAMKDLRQVNWGTFDEFKILNLARVMLTTTFGTDLTTSYCADNARYARPFCLAVIAR